MDNKALIDAFLRFGEKWGSQLETAKYTTEISFIKVLAIAELMDIDAEGQDGGRGGAQDCSYELLQFLVSIFGHWGPVVLDVSDITSEYQERRDRKIIIGKHSSYITMRDVIDGFKKVYERLSDHKGAILEGISTVKTEKSFRSDEFDTSYKLNFQT